MPAEIDDSAVAVVGMAGRFPGAGTIDELWELLKSAKEALSYITPEELTAAGVDMRLAEDPSYVKYRMKMEGVSLFDADFFGYSPRQAANIHPQQRIFLECAWEALEAAGYDPESSRELVGVFGGSGGSGNLFDSPASDSGESMMEWVLDNEKDFMTARVAYKLGLTGPCIAVQTACSTSLVAVHLACQSLLVGECDVALAGGATISAKNRGYKYIEHGILSPDGHCRAFDAAANGTVPGNGAGVVVLRRLADALNQGHEIHAIIKASIVNNDGSQKAGFTAPGLSSQRQLLARGLALAELRSSDIGYIEAHGTGTVLGDSIELTALKDVYGHAAKSCAIGSIKTNIGHLDTAAGVAGLIKAILCLKKGALVPSLGCVTPNPILQEPGCPFYVNTTFRTWERNRDCPRRAAVSSFGLGGTNAHVILEEGPEATPGPREEGPQILPVSARTPAALNAGVGNLASFLEQNSALNIADCAYTLQIGRKKFSCRRAVVGGSHSEIVSGLREQKGEVSKALGGRPIVFLFPGEGSEFPGMAMNLYRTDQFFRNQLDQCADLISACGGFDVLPFLCEEKPAGDSKLQETAWTQPALFAFEYCLARLWMNWGIIPSAMLGHGLGEYVAASIAEAISIKDAVRLVVERARLIHQTAEGSMVAVSLPEDVVRTKHGIDLAVAAVNSPDECVVAGAGVPIEKFIRVLESEGISYRRLNISHALYSPMMGPAAAALKGVASALETAEPKIRYISGVTGASVSGRQVREPAYWEEHLTSPVRFSLGLAALQDLGGAVFLEVGPGCALCDRAKEKLKNEKDLVFLNSMTRSDDRTGLLRVLANLWTAGATVDWKRLHDGGARRRVELPTYPFERRPYMPDAPATGRAIAPASRKGGGNFPPEKWFYLPAWKESMPLPHWKNDNAVAGGAWMVFEDEAGFGHLVTEELKAAGCEVISVRLAKSFGKTGEREFVINPNAPDDYALLMAQLKQRDSGVCRIIYCWSLAGQQKMVNDYSSLLFLTQALGRSEAQARCMILAVTEQLFDIAGENTADSAGASITALATVTSQELENLRCGIADLPALSGNDMATQQRKGYIKSILAEMSFLLPEPIMAYRGSHRLVRNYEPTALDWKMPAVRKLREEGVYLITGGMGRIGLVMAQDLARRHRARLVLMTRSPFPERAEREVIPVQSDVSESVMYGIHAVRKIEEAGGQVLVVTANVSDPADVHRALTEAERRFGPLNGVFHLAADLTHPSAHRPIMELSSADLDSQTIPKADGFHVLDRELRSRNLDFGVVFSSNASILGGVGFGAYAAANAIVDHVVPAGKSEGIFEWIVINWDGWSIPQGPVARKGLSAGVPDPFSITTDEGMDALWRIVCLSTASRIVVSKADLNERFDTWVRQPRAWERERSREQPSPVRDVQANGSVQRPLTALERSIVDVWKELLGTPEIGIEDNFLDLGGDSLIAVRISGRIRELVGVNIPPDFFVDVDCTVESLAQEILKTLTAAHKASTAAKAVPASTI